MTNDRKTIAMKAARQAAHNRREKWLAQRVVVDNNWSGEKRKYLLDITNRELEEYRKTHQVCEICGREEVARVNNQFVKNGNIMKLCCDHDHRTQCFRGVLCRRCNRAMGWYDKYQCSIQHYIKKT